LSALGPQRQYLGEGIDVGNFYEISTALQRNV
jgi:hypothetical protein